MALLRSVGAFRAVSRALVAISSAAVAEKNRYMRTRGCPPHHIHALTPTRRLGELVWCAGMRVDRLLCQETLVGSNIMVVGCCNAAHALPER